MVEYEYHERYVDEREFFAEIGGDPTFDRFHGCHCNVRVSGEKVNVEVWFDHSELGHEDGGEYHHDFSFDRVFFSQFHAEAMAMVEKWAREWAAHLTAEYAKMRNDESEAQS